MIQAFRNSYIQNFNQETYKKLVSSIESEVGCSIRFNVAETPIFVSKEFKDKLLSACEAIFDTILNTDFKEQSQGSLKGMIEIPGDEGKPVFMQLDFGVCDENGELVPKLIEAQGFPSLYAYQMFLELAFRKYFDIPSGYSALLNGYNEEEYVQLLKEVIVGNEDPKQVVLLEVEPEMQTTSIDFYATEKLLGIKVLCLSKMKLDGKTLYYLNEEGERIDIKRIYNRVIFDELDKRTDLQREFNFTEEVDVHWVEHPNWFFRISKYSLPFLKNKFVPETYFLNQLDEYPADLENFVLKPLFSFAGMGVKINIDKSDLDAIEDPENYILQRKVHYLPIIETLDVPAKCEIRMMVIWNPKEERPKVLTNIGRLSKGEMIGVRYNKDKTWVGGTICFFEE